MIQPRARQPDSLPPGQARAESGVMGMVPQSGCQIWLPPGRASVESRDPHAGRNLVAKFGFHLGEPGWKAGGRARVESCLTAFVASRRPRALGFVREATHLFGRWFLSGLAELRRRKPRLSLRPPGPYQSRQAERTLRALLPQPPPRMTRPEPVSGPIGSTSDSEG